MRLFALLLGAVATLDPFLGLLLGLAWVAFRLRKPEERPLRFLWQLLIVPLVFVAASLINNSSDPVRTTPVIIRGLDAVFGVALPIMLYSESQRRYKNNSLALAHTAIFVSAYGIIRFLLFWRVLALALDQAIEAMAQISPQMMQNMATPQSLDLLESLLPVSWIIPQLLALFLGFILFHRLQGTRFIWKEVFFPKYCNLLILLIVPLFFFPQTQLLFVNALIALCFLPAIQGIGVVFHFFSSISSNVFLMALLVLLIAFNLFLIALIGFADIWLDLRKIKTKGYLS